MAYNSFRLLLLLDARNITLKRLVVTRQQGMEGCFSAAQSDCRGLSLYFTTISAHMRPRKYGPEHQRCFANGYPAILATMFAFENTFIKLNIDYS